MKTSSQTAALLLAAGKGTRMHSELPKVLHELLGEPMLAYVYDAVDRICGASDLVWTVIGHKAELVRAAFPQRNPERWALQTEQRGTGHALQCAWKQLTEAGVTRLAVINGDTPLIPEEILRSFLEQAESEEADLAFMTLSLADPGAYGRVVREQGRPDGRVTAIIEAKDYSPSLHGPEPREINAGIYCLKMAAIETLLWRLTDSNKSGEFYITDLVGLAVGEGLKVIGVNCGANEFLLGVNSPKELMAAEDLLRAKLVEEHLGRHVLIRQRDSVRIGPRARIAPGASLVGPCEIYGAVEIESDVRIESHCWIKNSRLSSGCHIHSFCHIEDAQVGPACQVGPYARLRPAAVLEQGARVGNFVEIKKAVLGPGAKANHLTYLGDATIGAGANVGAGTITCNYDGKNKHKTTIGAQAFIGSNSALVAPVTIGENALVGAGSVVTKNVPDDALAIGRGRQVNLPRRKKP
jgi:bifunctional UDP-N-acetylglucosamine pyrophosphorylase/glucosamine-1-phosphate N-acetyltransferase